MLTFFAKCGKNQTLAMTSTHFNQLSYWDANVKTSWLEFYKGVLELFWKICCLPDLLRVHSTVFSMWPCQLTLLRVLTWVVTTIPIAILFLMATGIVVPIPN